MGNNLGWIETYEAQKYFEHVISIFLKCFYF